MNWEQLCRPFSQSEIKQRKGRKGMYFNYVPSDSLVIRLNECGPDKWQFIIKESKEIRDEIIVLGSLTICEITKEGYGSTLIEENKGVGDCFKSASALALVKSASLFGIPCIFHAKPQNQQEQPRQEEREPSPQLPVQTKPGCAECGIELTEKIYNWSMKNLGAALCLRHQRNRGAI
ncbi:hypothetical protein ACHHV8_11265 [Paenibacillus sp. TAB 01]|uniref:hypothetical protein n=1 Tax=Paenibacillus sp. TAB 01 TaxID=3368988 RepID=UPI0037523E67